jgi:hypothetical protein
VTLSLLTEAFFQRQTSATGGSHQSQALKTHPTGWRGCIGQGVELRRDFSQRAQATGIDDRGEQVADSAEDRLLTTPETSITCAGVVLSYRSAETAHRRPPQQQRHIGGDLHQVMNGDLEQRLRKGGAGCDPYGLQLGLKRANIGVNAGIDSRLRISLHRAGGQRGDLLAQYHQHR